MIVMCMGAAIGIGVTNTLLDTTTEEKIQTAIVMAAFTCSAVIITQYLYWRFEASRRPPDTPGDQPNT